MKSQINYQDDILDYIKAKKLEVIIYFVNGYQLKGKVIGFDNFTIILHSDGRDQMIYKHAISTIAPVEKVEGFLKLIKNS